VFAKRAAERAEQTEPRRKVEGFPDAFEYTEEIGWVPEGWKLKTVLDLSEKLSKGTTPRKADLSKAEDDVNIPFLKVKDIDNDGFIKIDGLESIPRSIHEGALKRSIVKEGDVLFSIAGTIGRTSVIPEELNDSNTNQAIAFIRPADIRKSSFLLQLLKSENIQNLVQSKIVQAVQANVSLTVLGNLPVIEPCEDVFNFWFDKTNETFIKISELQNNSGVLSKLRDTLLPKLLSGELRIPDAEKLIEEVKA